MSPRTNDRGRSAFDEPMKALSDATRREILHLTAERERSASELAGAFDMTRPAVSQHLRILLDAGLLEVREEGTRRLYSSNRETLRGVFGRLDEYWSLGLVRLQRAAEKEARKGASAPSSGRSNAKGRGRRR